MKYSAHEHLVIHPIVHPGTYTDITTPINNYFTKGYAREAFFIAVMTAIETSFQIKIVHSDDGIEWEGFVGVQGNGPLSAVMTTSPQWGIGQYVGRVDLEGAKRNVCCQLISVGATTGYVLAIMLDYAKLPPKTNLVYPGSFSWDTTLMFNIQ